MSDRSEARSIAVVVGASGGIGGALAHALAEGGRFADVVGLGRRGDPALDLTDENSIVRAAAAVAAMDGAPRLIIDATGFLHNDRYQPEKTWRRIAPDHMAHAFAVNAIGPALLMKHFLPLLPRAGKAMFATLSAKVGSIGDNAIGGWYSYRASKAALNQIVRTAAIELRLRWPDAVCVALHPGTVDSGLSSPFAKTGLDVVTPEVAAGRLLAVIERLSAAESGGFFDYRGERLPW